MKKIHLTGNIVINKSSNDEITEKEQLDLIDALLEVIEKHDYSLSGGWELITDDELIKRVTNET